MSTCKIKVHNIIFIFIIFSFIIFSDHIVLVFKLYQTILNYNITQQSMGMLKSCDEENICTIHIIATFEPIDSTMKTKAVEKELYCIPIRNTSTGKIEINSPLKKDHNHHMTKINELGPQEDFVSYTKPKLSDDHVSTKILQDLEKLLDDNKEAFAEN